MKNCSILAVALALSGAALAADAFVVPMRTTTPSSLNAKAAASKEEDLELTRKVIQSFLESDSSDTKASSSSVAADTAAADAKAE